MKKIILKFLDILKAFHTIIWCFFNGVKFKKGVRVGFFVKKKRHVKLILENGTLVWNHVMFWGNGTVKIGKKTSIGPNSKIFSSRDGGVEIGSFNNFASDLYIIDSDHDTSKSIMIGGDNVSRKITIGSKCWIGYHVTILKGVLIADGCVVGACSLVTKPLPKNTICGGVPARVLKNRAIINENNN